MSQTFDTERFRLSRACVVSLSAKGVRLPRYSAAPALPLGLAEVTLLNALAGDGGPIDAVVQRVAAETDNSADAVRAFATTLVERQLLHPADSARPWPAESLRPSRGSDADHSVDRDQELVLVLPVTLGVGPDGFDIVDHEGRLEARLTPTQLIAIAQFARPNRPDRAWQAHHESLGERALSRAQLDRLVDDLLVARLLIPASNPAELERVGRLERRTQVHAARMTKLAKVSAEALAAYRAERASEPGARPAVVPVANINPMPVLALGMITAAALEHDGGALTRHFDIYPQGSLRWHSSTFTSADLGGLGPKPILLYSDYIWSIEENIELSRRVKESDPSSLNVHGGPDAPKYEGDIAAFFERHPHVDVIVHGEGEVTTVEMLSALAADTNPDRYDLSALAPVAGLSYRDGHRIVTTGSRDRVADLDLLPSPYLTGVFDIYKDIGPLFITIETNRGCPYGCTFCDWGSATQSRIRKFSLDRVFAELEWCAVNKVENVMVADANFGIFARDVEIAQKVAELKQQYGYPKAFGTNYAKNTIKHLKPIVEVLVEAGILTEGLLSLQSMDSGTLDTIERSNIKLEKYEQLLQQFRKAKLPLMVDLMMGLPGSTLESFKNDLQGCADRDVTAKIFSTMVLTNSPMNEPSYREKHRIEVDDRPRHNVIEPPMIVSTATFTREDYREMERLRLLFFLGENFGILRQVGRYARHETGLPEVELLTRLKRDALADPDRWPMLALLVEVVPHLMVPPISWRLLIDELHDYFVDELQIDDDSALFTVLEVQHALLPAFGRQFPLLLDLPHDYAKWHQLVIEAKDSGHLNDWREVVEPLRALPPATFAVDDPKGLCDHGLGFRVEFEPYADWELSSPVARPMPAKNEM
jgi:radical SAM superfamily enzyme YgiQ (UPF0313 family)